MSASSASLLGRKHVENASAYRRERCVLGINPKASGALALCSADTQQAIEVRDMPSVKVSGGQRKLAIALDVQEILHLFQSYAERQEILFAIMEKWDDAFHQSERNTFKVGYAHGVFHAACLNAKMPLQTVRSPDWKRQLYIPGRHVPIKIYNNRVRLRVLDLFQGSDLFYTSDEHFSINRSEAALLAYFGIQRYLR